MKNIIKNKIWIVALLLSAACVNPDDLVTEDSKSGGAVLKVDGSGKLLGTPDSETNEVTFSDNELSMTVDLQFPVSDVEEYAIVKRFNGVEVVEETFTELPHTFAISDLDNFLEGLDVEEGDLRIGDVFSFVVRITHEDGRILYSDAAQLSITVNCSSALAGSYTYSGTWDRAETGNADVPVGPFPETITEVSPGVYKTTRSGHYTAATIDDPCPFIFEDVCGVLTIPSQNLCDAYSNQVEGEGTFDPATGNLHFEYIITFAAGNRVFHMDYVKND